MSLLKVVCKSFLPTDLYITNKMVKNKGVPEQKPLFHFPPHPLLLLLFFLRASGLRNESIWDSLSSCSTSLTDLSLSFWAQRLPRKWRSCLTKPASFLISDLIFPRYTRYLSAQLDPPGFDSLFFRCLMCFSLRFVLCSGKAEDGGRALSHAPRVPHRTRASRESRESLSVFYFRSNWSLRVCGWDRYLLGFVERYLLGFVDMPMK